MIKAEIIRGGVQWRDRFHAGTFRAATIDTLEQELPAVVADARRDVPVSPYSKEHLRDTIKFGIDRQKGMGWIQAGGTRVVWYAHLIELGFHGYTGKRMVSGKRIRGNYRTHMTQSRYHKGVRFMGNAVQGRSTNILKGLRSNLHRRLGRG